MNSEVSEEYTHEIFVLIIAQDFYEYIQKIDRYGMKAGIVKVIPPKEWLQTLPDYNASNLDKVKIRQPIAQHMLGRSGLYKQTNVVKRSVMGVDQWASLAGCGHQVKFQFPTPAPHQSDDPSNESGRVTRGRGSTVKMKEAPKKKRRRTTAEHSQALDEGKTDYTSSVKDEQSDGRVSTPQSGQDLPDSSQISHQPQLPIPDHRTNGQSSEDHNQGSLPPAEQPDQHTQSTRQFSAQIEGSAASQKQPPARNGSEIIESTAKPSAKKKREEQANEFYDGLNIYDVWLPEGAKHEDYNVEGCKYLERQYWRTLGLGDNEVSWYGADLSGGFPILITINPN